MPREGLNRTIRITPDDRLVWWAELEETTQPGDAFRTYRSLKQKHARLVVPIPMWAAGLYYRTLSFWRHLQASTAS